MEELSFKDLSNSKRKVFESENTLKNIFDILDKESRLNFHYAAKNYIHIFKKGIKFSKQKLKSLIQII